MRELLNRDMVGSRYLNTAFNTNLFLPKIEGIKIYFRTFDGLNLIYIDDNNRSSRRSR